ncbi:MAG: (d)CMP kinase [Proteobacteria bacterium]|nr:(d)CMP kinase [Desulfobulbaceae bacterium]MBU4154148.1 (d)CMP kinase [Pseudomonadota bacterium]
MSPLSQIITIDGPSGSGKSTISRLLAQRLGITFLDTGAMYRAVGLAASRQGLDLTDTDAVKQLMANIDLQMLPGVIESQVIMNGEDVSDAIRTADMGMMASKVSALGEVRQNLTSLQKALGAKQAVVAEGRDMGTVVFPTAKHKFFLSATADERARRRTAQLHEKGLEANGNEILEQIKQRDHDDSRRSLAPLKPADDAVIIDSSTMTIEDVVQFMVDRITKP